jgi:hypothetical protein
VWVSARFIHSDHADLLEQSVPMVKSAHSPSAYRPQERYFLPLVPVIFNKALEYRDQAPGISVLYISDIMEVNTMNSFFLAPLFRASVCTLALALSFILTAAEPVVIELTQTGCQFIESENGVDHGYVTHAKADCDRINAETTVERLAQARTLELEPGRYIFRVYNRDVPYELGFWLRGASLLDRALLPSVSGGGLVTGASRDYDIELESGEYLYSCPLNNRWTNRDRYFAIFRMEVIRQIPSFNTSTITKSIAVDWLLSGLVDMVNRHCVV